ncbi:MAG: N-acetylmuramoyl-L-alanine amidase [Candidatus Riflebacteria bacterium]|nr:N-acetylmuramoyl-L-alanine amidase [Candidatus Riflebacteria bacterium]
MKYRFRIAVVVLLVATLAGSPTVRCQTLAETGGTLFSPQTSPTGRELLWECLDRNGSIWITDRSGAAPTFLTQGHSPSWVDGESFKFVRSVDDGHQVLAESLYLYELPSGRVTLLAAGTGNADYVAVATPATTVSFPERGLAGTVVCLDPGHGMNTGAYCDFSKKIEDVYALQSAYMVKNYLERSGATVEMTRYTHGQNPALTARVNFSNSVGAKVFHSIHYNSATNATARGSETWYRSGDTTSRAQARKVQGRMIEAAGLPDRGARADKENLGYYLGVLSANHATRRKSLSEGGFLSNADDAAAVDDPEVNDRLSWGVYAGLCDTLNVTPVAPWTPVAEPLVEKFAGPLSDRWVGAPVETSQTPTPGGDDAAAVISSAPGRPACLRTGGFCWRDYTVAATVRLDGEEIAPYGLLARCSAQDGEKWVGYVLSVDERQKEATLLASMDSSGTAIVVGRLPLGDTPAKQRWRSLTVECAADQVKASVDGVPLAPVEVSSSAQQAINDVIRRGQVGVLLSASSSKARLAIDELSMTVPSPGRSVQRAPVR